MAVVKASEDLRRKIIARGARLLEASMEEVEFDGENIVTLEGNKSLSLKKLAEVLALGEGKQQLIGNATYGNEQSPPPFIAGFVEIELDKETGKFDVINYVSVIDCGTVINPNLARIQAEGGIVQGIGMAMYEDVRYDEKGKLVTNSFMQYKIPTRKDVGNLIVDFKPSFEPTGPFGAKSIGEIVVNTPSPAIANAVFNASGVRVTTLPITSEKVFMGMYSK
jgi:CO/xanthine dehydrogenase Mo-binding subunit